MSVMEKARDLASAIRESPEFVRILHARKEIESHEAARIMFRDFEKMRMDMEALAKKGEKIPEQKLDAFKRSFEIISYNPYIRDLLDAEVAFARLFTQVQQVIAEPLEDLGPAAAGTVAGTAPF
ncbi:MAG: YlbF family regulator [Bacillota bacterium]|nr:YlbF family regulator [Bacillota bacterium]